MWSINDHGISFILLMICTLCSSSSDSFTSVLCERMMGVRVLSKLAPEKSDHSLWLISNIIGIVMNTLL